MKKFSVLTVFILLLFGASFLNAQAFEGAGDKKLQIGLSPYGHGTGINGTFDYGIARYFSVGVGGEFYFDNDKDRKNDADFFIFGRLNAHLGSLLNMPSSMDLYPGIDVGLLGDKMGFDGHLGFRYFWSNNIGAYVEVGSRGSIGLSFNL
ncbi:MAG: hypothetical protein Q4G27_08510 [Flavobacteriaceae bacterium]|nr:hypothetical protein [Flavobacteriaceae bacterium]